MNICLYEYFIIICPWCFEPYSSGALSVTVFEECNLSGIFSLLRLLMNGTPSNGGNSYDDVQKLREELAMCRNKLSKWEEGVSQARVVSNDV